jgi:hypothetical protein
MTDVEMQESVKTNGDAEKSETNVEKMDDSGPVSAIFYHLI